MQISTDRFADNVAQAVSLHTGLAACATGHAFASIFYGTCPESPWSERARHFQKCLARSPLVFYVPGTFRSAWPVLR